MLWRAASSYTQTGFYAAIKELKGLNPKAHEYLEKVDPRTGVEDGSTQVQSVTFCTTTWLSASIVRSSSFGIRPS
jgi:hypothetical protein